MLFCAHGGISPIPIAPPPGFESHFAEVVVAVNDAKTLTGVAVSQFSIFNSTGQPIYRLKRVVSIERFVNEPPPPDWGYMAYYLRSEMADKTYVWNETLARGSILLRIRMSLLSEGQESVAKRCSLSIGPYQTDGPVDGTWPTG
jgi:hypothetical protein